MLATMKSKGGTMPKRQHDPDDDLDERGLLRDGRRIRVPMMMRDSADGLTDLQRSVRDHFAPARVVDAFGNSGLALSRPGARYLTAGTRTPDHAALVMRDHERREARDEYVQQLCDAWKGTGTNDREVARVHDTGDAVRDAYLDSVADLTTSWSRRSDAWRGPNTNDREVARVHNTGDAVRDAYLDQKYDLENAWHRGTGKR
jgi:hypothetical protein